jgi:hypothetical protein
MPATWPTFWSGGWTGCQGTWATSSCWLTRSVLRPLRIPVIPDTSSGRKRTRFRSKADTVPAESGQARGAVSMVVFGCQVAQPMGPGP